MSKWNFSRWIASKVTRRFSSEAAVALRPFYFAVHPDRFPNHPDVKKQNEKALQIFNGYISDVYASNRSLQPVEVKFFISAGSRDKFREIRVQLKGEDARLIVKAALNACGLPTDSLPPVFKQVAAKRFEHMDSEINSGFRKKRSSYFIKKNDLREALKKSRQSAIEARQQFRRISLFMEDDIKEIKQRLSLAEVVWTMDWALSHMKRCLVAVNRLIDNTTPLNLSTMKKVLYGNILRFGRGTHMCCDGGLQFGADSVPEQWQNVCIEALGNKKFVDELVDIRMNLSNILGGAHIVSFGERPLLQTAYHLNQLYQRILQAGKFQRIELRKLCADTTIDVLSSYDEMLLTKGGSLCIPYNVDLKYFIEFAQKFAQNSRDTRCIFNSALRETEVVREYCVAKLKLEELNWQSDLNIDELKASIIRLCEQMWCGTHVDEYTVVALFDRLGCSAYQSVRPGGVLIKRRSNRDLTVDSDIGDLLEGLSIRFTTNPTIYVMNDGRLSIPTGWI